MPITECCGNPSGNFTYRAFDINLQGAGPCGNSGAAIMLGYLVVHGIDARIVPVFAVMVHSGSTVVQNL